MQGIAFGESSTRILLYQNCSLFTFVTLMRNVVHRKSRPDLSNTAYRMSAPIKLWYLPFRARAESTKMILAYGGVEYEDITVSFQDWGSKVKKEGLGTIHQFGQLPSMQMANGAIVSQSCAISELAVQLSSCRSLPCAQLIAVRYAGHLANVCPSTPEACAEADMIVQLALEMNAINPIVNW